MSNRTFSRHDYLTAILAADAACIATVNLPADNPARIQARMLRDTLHAIANANDWPSAYHEKMPDAYSMLYAQASYCNRHVL